MQVTSLVISLCVFLSVVFESMSYVKQIIKTTRMQRSNDVSAKAYGYKLFKYAFALIALYFAKNWVGVGLETWAFILCIATYMVVKRNKARK